MTDAIPTPPVLLCGHPPIPARPGGRGVCHKCYYRFHWQVYKKKTTWEALEASGLTAPLGHKAEALTGYFRPRQPRAAPATPPQATPLWLAGCTVVQAALTLAEAIEDGEAEDAAACTAALLKAVRGYRRLRGDTIPLPPVKRGAPLRMTQDEKET